MTTQTLATGSGADPINFENYALLYDELTTTQADLDEESCPLPYWGIFPDDRELSSLWAEVISAGRSLAEFLNASDEKYSLPTSPMIIVARDAMTVWATASVRQLRVTPAEFPAVNPARARKPCLSIQGSPAGLSQSAHGQGPGHLIQHPESCATHEQ